MHVILQLRRKRRKQNCAVYCVMSKSTTHIYMLNQIFACEYLMHFFLLRSSIYINGNTTDPTTGTCALKEAEDHIVREDRALQLQKTSQFSHLNAIAESVGWRKLWDQTLDHGPSCVKSVKNLVRIISYPDYATSRCPRCEITELDPPSLPAHIMVKHTNSDSWDTLINSLVPTLFSHVLCLLNVF